MKNEHKRPSGCITLRIAAVLLCLVLFSMHLTAGLYARYTAKQGGTDSARVAAFNVDVEGVGNSVTVDYVKGNGQDAGIQRLLITNNSEVAVSYDITVEIEDVNFGISVTLNGKVLSTDEPTTLKFTDVGQIPPNSSQFCDLEFKVVDWGAFTQKKDATKIEGKLEYSITVDVVQID